MVDPLLALLRARALGLLEEARQELLDLGVLGSLEPVEGWEGTPLDGHLLGAVPASGLLEPIAKQVVHGLLAFSINSSDATAGLFGWDPNAGGGAQARGIAWAVRITDGGSNLAAALVVDDPGQLRLLATGATVEGVAELAFGQWSLSLSGQADGTLDVRWLLEGPPTIVSGSAADTMLRATLRRTAPPVESTGPGIDLGKVDIGAELTVLDNDRLSSQASLRIVDGALRLTPDALSVLPPELDTIPVDVDISVSSERGARIGSPTLRARLPVAGVLPGIVVGPLSVDLDPVQGLKSLSVNARTSLAFTLPGTPLRLDLAGVGLTIPFSLGDGDSLGFVRDAITGGSPTGADVALKLPIVRAHGRLLTGPRDSYAGVLGAEMPPLSAAALGALTLQPPSFVAILAATFPPPGIQIGFGIAVNGVGGIIGVNRGVDHEALLRAVADGSVAQLLFPRGPVAGAESALRAVNAVFPPRAGSVVAGPMVEFTWGRKLVTGAAALILELSEQPRVALLGKLVVALPTTNAPIVYVQATFAGQIDFAEPSTSFLASLSGHIAGVAISGDLFLLVRGGPDATFVLSGGGFHPRFVVPRGVPALRRLALELSASPFLRLRCEAYLAITSNTVQFGARLELVAEVAGCGLRGHLQLDVLIQFQPQLSFIADLSAAVAIRVAGATLAGIHLQLSLEGPTPWRARGRGRLELLFFPVSFRFDEQWGLPRPPPEAVSDKVVAQALTAAFSRPEAWVVHRPAGAPAGVRLTAHADERLGTGAIVDPFGSLTARQRVVPLEQRIERFQRLPLPQPQFWEITGVGIGTEPSDRPSSLVSEQFAPGEFLSLTDDEQLTQPAFRYFTAGSDLSSRGVKQDDRSDKTVDIEFEEGIIPGIEGEPILVSNELDSVNVPMLHAVEMVVAANDVSHPALWRPPVGQVAIESELPVAFASTWSLAPLLRTFPVTIAESAGSAGSAEPQADDLEVFQADPGVIVVEAWELEV